MQPHEITKIVTLDLDLENSINEEIKIVILVTDFYTETNKNIRDSNFFITKECGKVITTFPTFLSFKNELEKVHDLTIQEIENFTNWSFKQQNWFSNNIKNYNE